MGTTKDGGLQPFSLIFVFVVNDDRYMENVRARQRQMVKWRQKLKKPLCPQPNAKGNDEWRAARVQPADNVPHHRRHSWPIKRGTRQHPHPRSLLHY
ncbi:hypothetical protein QUC31_009258 [Theobroma cacao]